MSEVYRTNLGSGDMGEATIVEILHPRVHISFRKNIKGIHTIKFNEESDSILKILIDYFCGKTSTLSTRS